MPLGRGSVGISQVSIASATSSVYPKAAGRDLQLLPNGTIRLCENTNPFQVVPGHLERPTVASWYAMLMVDQPSPINQNPIDRSPPIIQILHQCAPSQQDIRSQVLISYLLSGSALSEFLLIYEKRLCASKKETRKLFAK